MAQLKQEHGLLLMMGEQLENACAGEPARHVAQVGAA
jgi:hypothetical protein